MALPVMAGGSKKQDGMEKAVNWKSQGPNSSLSYTCQWSLQLSDSPSPHL